MKILFIDIAHPILQSSLEKAGHVCDDGTKLSREEILKIISKYDGVTIRSRIVCDKEFLDVATQLKFIARAGAGMESIDVKYAANKNIICINSPEGNRDAVGEHAIGMLLSLFNKLNKADREVREAKWIREANRGVELQGKTVGIIGYGNMGSAFAKKLSGFECTVIAYDKFNKNFSDAYAKEVSMKNIFEDTDVLSLHLPLTSDTEFMINKSFITQFKKNIFIINTARGKVLRTDDLVEGIKSGKILGACLDVNEYEETSFEEVRSQKSEIGSQNSEATTSSQQPAASNNSWQYLIASGKVILSPHIAGWTVESNEKIARVLFEKIVTHFPK
jgi:D-3-phosphoglycerate dehydrogenase